MDDSVYTFATKQFLSRVVKYETLKKQSNDLHKQMFANAALSLLVYFHSISSFKINLNFLYIF